MTVVDDMVDEMDERKHRNRSLSESKEVALWERSVRGQFIKKNKPNRTKNSLTCSSLSEIRGRDRRKWRSMESRLIDRFDELRWNRW